jgi:hypothetical protein
MTKAGRAGRREKVLKEIKPLYQRRKVWQQQNKI